MKTLVWLILTIILTSSCASFALDKDEITCNIIKRPDGTTVMLRCENDEVICYRSSVAHNSGMSCKFKDKK
jgi:hypothetical protein